MPGTNGDEGESVGQQTNPGSPERKAVYEGVCVIFFSFWSRIVD